MSHYIPRVEIIQPIPKDGRKGVITAHMTRVVVDGQEWPCTAYTIRGAVDDVQTVTLTFLADVTLTQEGPK